MSESVRGDVYICASVATLEGPKIREGRKQKERRLSRRIHAVSLRHDGRTKQRCSPFSFYVHLVEAARLAPCVSLLHISPVSFFFFSLLPLLFPLSILPSTYASLYFFTFLTLVDARTHTHTHTTECCRGPPSAELRSAVRCPTIRQWGTETTLKAFLKGGGRKLPSFFFLIRKIRAA